MLIKKTYGFSLLEVMVVVFLMALFSTVAILRLGVGQGTIIESEARQFAEKLNLLMDESLLSGQVYRIVFDVESYTYEYQHYDGQWVAMVVKPFEKRTLAGNIAFEMEVIQASTTTNLRANPQANDGKTRFENRFGESTSIESARINVVEIDSDGVSTEFDVRFGERTNNNTLDSEGRVWLVQGGQSVTVNQANTE